MRHKQSIMQWPAAHEGVPAPVSKHSSCQPDAGTAVVGVLGSAKTGGGVFQGVLPSSLRAAMRPLGVLPSVAPSSVGRHLCKNYMSSRTTAAGGATFCRGS